MHSQWKQRRQSPDPTVLCYSMITRGSSSIRCKHESLRLRGHNTRTVSGFSMRRKRSYGKVLIMKFDPSKIEAKWQQKWEEAKVFEMDLEKAKKPYYTL